VGVRYRRPHCRLFASSRQLASVISTRYRGGSIVCCLSHEMCPSRYMAMRCTRPAAWTS
jgi:hypothetical protein